MSSISAGLVKATNITVSGIGAGAVETTNFNATNVNTVNVNASGSLNAPNLTSNVQIAKDRWHLPTPTGPFAVDIIPCAAKNIPFTIDLFGQISNKFWGTMDYYDNLYATIYAPSNRTGEAKNVSASLVGNVDPSNNSNTLVCGAGLFHPDDFVFRGKYDYNSPIDTDFTNAVEAWEAYFKSVCSVAPGNNTIDSSANVRAQLNSLWANIESTYTYQNLYRHFSIATGKIWYNPQTNIEGTEYKDFVTEDVSNNIYNGTKFFTTSYVPSENLPSLSEITEETGDPSGCPVIIKIAGLGDTEYISDPWHSSEMASRGFIVIILGYAMCESNRYMKTGTNQTVIDCIRNGYLGNATNFDPTKIPQLANFATKRNLNDFSATNYNDSSQLDYYGNPGVNRFPLYYTDENGRTNYINPDHVRIANSIKQSNLSHTSTGTTSFTDFSGNVTNIDTSGTTTYNNIVSYEKYIYTLKYFLTRISGFESFVNFGNTSIYVLSNGGCFYSITQLISDNQGYTRCLGVPDGIHIPDTSNNGIYMFNLNSAILLNPLLLQSKQESVGFLLWNNNAPNGTPSYSYPDSALLGSALLTTQDSATCLPVGFTVPILAIEPPGPNMISFDNFPISLSVMPEQLQYLLQKTRASNASPFNSFNQNIVNNSLVYNLGTYHDIMYGFNDADQLPSIGPCYYLNFQGGWDWPNLQAFDNFVYDNGNFGSVQSQQLFSDLNKTPLMVMWNLHNQLTIENDSPNEVSIAKVLAYGNRGAGDIVLGSNYVENSQHLDSFFRYIGPHKLETLLDTSNINHFSVDFGRQTLWEGFDNNLHLTAHQGASLSVPANLCLDGSGAFIKIGSTTISESQLQQLLSLI